QEIKWTNSPKVFIEITLLSITNRYEENNETASEGADSQEVLKLTGKLAELEKEIALLKQQPQGNAQPEPTKSRRPIQRTGKNSYKIPYERIKSVLNEAEKQALKQVQAKWASLLNKLKTVNAPAH